MEVKREITLRGSGYAMQDREFEFIIYNRTENKIILDTVRQMNTTTLIKSMNSIDDHGVFVYLPPEKRLFRKIQSMIINNSEAKPISIQKYITNNCQTENHRWCRGKSARWGICECDCHLTKDGEC